MGVEIAVSVTSRSCAMERISPSTDSSHVSTLESFVFMKSSARESVISSDDIKLDPVVLLVLVSGSHLDWAIYSPLKYGGKSSLLTAIYCHRENN
jgi:hypothetical protein